MKKYCKLGIVMMLCLFFATGCGGVKQEVMKMQEDGVWEERHQEEQYDIGGDNAKEIVLINVKKDMTEKEMLKILDYYELELINNTPENIEKGICYAIFYQGDTDEIIRKYKYSNGEILEIKKEDEAIFTSMETMKINDDE